MLFLDMAAVAVGFGIKGTLAIMAGSTVLAGVDFVHGDLDGSLLHFRKHVLVVAILALVTGFLMQFAIERYGSHGTVGEFNSFPSRDSERNSGTKKQDTHGQND